MCVMSSGILPICHTGVVGIYFPLAIFFPFFHWWVRQSPFFGNCLFLLHLISEGHFCFLHLKRPDFPVMGRRTVKGYPGGNCFAYWHVSQCVLFGKHGRRFFAHLPDVYECSLFHWDWLPSHCRCFYTNETSVSSVELLLFYTNMSKSTVRLIDFNNYSWFTVV